jgi:glycosyltransferase involved in cell wall biosynthesis
MKAKPKILQLVSVRWWNASAYYGISLAKALNMLRVPTVVAGRENSPPIKQAKTFELPLKTNINLESINPFICFKNYFSLKNILLSEKINLINSHRPEDHIYGVLTKNSLSPKIPLIRTVSDVRSPKTNIINYWQHKYRTDFFIFSCKKSYERYQSVWPIFENKNKVIYSAIDTEYFHPHKVQEDLRKKYSVSDDEILIGIIARLSPVKDHETFLRAAAKVFEKYPGVRFLISGEESQITHHDLKKLASQLGVFEKVIFLHRDEKVNIRDLINSLDIGVVASNGSEVICRISLEFMAMQKPQVATDINVLPEIIEDGKNGFTVPPKNHDVMAERLMALIKNKELRKQMGERARQIAERKYSLPVFAEKTIEVYQQVLSR